MPTSSDQTGLPPDHIVIRVLNGLIAAKVNEIEQCRAEIVRHSIEIAKLKPYHAPITSYECLRGSPDSFFFQSYLFEAIRSLADRILNIDIQISELRSMKLACFRDPDSYQNDFWIQTLLSGRFLDRESDGDNDTFTQNMNEITNRCPIDFHVSLCGPNIIADLVEQVDALKLMDIFSALGVEKTTEDNSKVFLRWPERIPAGAFRHLVDNEVLKYMVRNHRTYVFCGRNAFVFFHTLRMKIKYLIAKESF